jgi:hypothetical protein
VGCSFSAPTSLHPDIIDKIALILGALKIDIKDIRQKWLGK